MLRDNIHFMIYNTYTLSYRYTSEIGKCVFDVLKWRTIYVCIFIYKWHCCRSSLNHQTKYGIWVSELCDMCKCRWRVKYIVRRTHQILFECWPIPFPSPNIENWSDIFLIQWTMAMIYFENSANWLDKRTTNQPSKVEITQLISCET